MVEGTDDMVRRVVAEWVAERGRGTAMRLAEATGVRPQTVTKWLQGDTRIPEGHWLTIEETLGQKPLTLARVSGAYELIKTVDDPIALWETLHPRRQGASILGKAAPRRIKEIETRLEELEESGPERIKALEGKIEDLEKTISRLLDKLDPPEDSTSPAPSAAARRRANNKGARKSQPAKQACR